MAIVNRAHPGLLARVVRPTSLSSSKARSTGVPLLHRQTQHQHQQSSFHTITKPSSFLPTQRSCQRIAIPSPMISQIRHTSSSPATSKAAAAAAAAANSPTGPAEVLTWNEFLRLRKIRRRFNLVASASLASVTFVTGLAWLSEQNLEQMGSTLFGLDPLFVMGLSALGFAGAGWVLGPFLGSAIWRASYSSRVKGMAAKERDFFVRIKKYRVDPSNSSVQNPVPDYYGEKITSVQGYRRWLKDQRAFNKKREL